MCCADWDSAREAMLDLPRKLKTDAVAEALLEVRFDSTELGELVVGKLASHEMWKSFPSNRLPFADIPAPIRQADPNLAYQAVLERRNPDMARVVKIGDRVFSYHALPPYPGWDVWEPELFRAVEFVFTAIEGFAAKRLGFRYINVLTPDHSVHSARMLNFNVAVAGASLDAPLNLNYLRTPSELHNAIVRIASKEFVQNPVPGLSALLDIDVFTPAGFSTADISQARQWVSEAHEYLKEEFFGLLTDALKQKLVED
jgi:uncharacterized protein (TIGR04255 family)